MCDTKSCWANFISVSLHLKAKSDYEISQLHKIKTNEDSESPRDTWKLYLHQIGVYPSILVGFSRLDISNFCKACVWRNALFCFGTLNVKIQSKTK
jgi:hypothetical protein